MKVLYLDQVVVFLLMVGVFVCINIYIERERSLLNCVLKICILKN